MKTTFKTKEGHTIYVTDNGVGGRRYLSDEIGGGVLVWDTALINEMTLFEVIHFEHDLMLKEKEEQEAVNVMMNEVLK
jgi:hypothetical protein